jgi:hypothetical protein
MTPPHRCTVRSFLVRFATSADPLVLLAIAAASTISYTTIITLPLLGWDSLPLIESSRVNSPGSISHLLTRPWISGWLQAATFFRPLTSLLTAVDYFFWGLNPIGYHLTDLLLFVLCSYLLYRLSRKLLGPRSSVASAFCAFLFCLHSAHIEVFISISRRSEFLSLAFLLLSLMLASSPSLSLRRAILATLASTLASLAKETGFAAYPLLVLAFLFNPNSSAGRRTLLTLMPTTMMLLVFSWRAAVIGSFGGYASTAAFHVIDSPPAFLLEAFTSVLYPHPLWPPASSPTVGASVIGVFLACILLLAARVFLFREHTALIVFIWCWTVLLLLMAALSGRIHPWYATQLVAPFSLSIAAITTLLVRLSRGPVLVVSIALVILVVHSLWGTPLLWRYPEWKTAGDRAARALREIREGVRSGRARPVLRVYDFPLGIPPPGRPARPATKSLFILTDYSVQAYLKLTCPDQPAVARLFYQQQVSSSGRIDVVLFPGPDPLGRESGGG